MAYGLVIQCYIKVDTLDALCKSLVKCSQTDDFNVIFWVDKVRSLSSFDGDFGANAAVLDYIETFRGEFGHLFASIEVKTNESNLGTCKTCQASLDYAFRHYDLVAFTEDDTIFARDALAWGVALYKRGILNEKDVIALAGESIYFDSRREQVDAAYIETAAREANGRGYFNKYMKLNFVPSTCFFTTKTKWDIFGSLRGQPRGDEDVCELCREQDLFCVFPVVARVKDVGMLHDKGHSVRTHGAESVSEIKNTYLLSDDVIPFSDYPEPFLGNTGRLFEESVKMMGFRTEVAAPAIHSTEPWKLWCFSLRNFGDALTPLIFKRYNIPFELVENFDEANILGIGSNLDRVRSDHPPIVVWSSGFMYPKAKPISYNPRVRFLGVRGHQTAAMVKPSKSIDPAIGDGGLLVTKLLAHESVTKQYDLGIVPHMSDVASMRALGMTDWPRTKIINVLDPVDQVLAEIASCRRIASSSLHGLITADAFDIPNCQLVFSHGRELEGAGFKYEDYASALSYHMPRMTLDDGISFGSLVERLDMMQPARADLAPVIGELELTMHVLRGQARGLCQI
jgi:hypothetical protein